MPECSVPEVPSRRTRRDPEWPTSCPKVAQPLQPTCVLETALDPDSASSDQIWPRSEFRQSCSNLDQSRTSSGQIGYGRRRPQVAEPARARLVKHPSQFGPNRQGSVALGRLRPMLVNSWPIRATFWQTRTNSGRTRARFGPKSDKHIGPNRPGSAVIGQKEARVGQTWHGLGVSAGGVATR